MTDPLTHSTRFAYDANDNLTSLTDALNRTTAYSYDELDRQITQLNALGDDRAYTYDAVGNLIAVTDELERTTTYTYDNRNLLIQVTDPLAHSTTYNYDAVGNRTAVTDALGHTTQFVYDELYRQTQVIDPLEQVTLMTYDEGGNLLTLKDASNFLTTFTYDPLNRLDTETITVDGQALVRDYDYDAASNLTRLTDRNGRQRTFVYDELNRQTHEYWLDAADTPFHTFTYTYDAASQLTAAGDAHANYSYTYDLAGRLTSVDHSGTLGVPNVVLTYGYDAVNNLTAVTDTIGGVQAGVEAFQYDALNRVTRLTQSGAGVAEKRVDMTYDAASQMESLTRYRDLAGTQLVAETVYDFDLAGRLTDLTHQRGANVLADYGLTYDEANRLTQLVTPDSVSDYGYNDRNELTSSDHTDQSDEAYNYDATGNRIGNVIGDHNRLLEDDTFTYEYDNEGNRTRRVDKTTGEVTEYNWDFRNRLTSITTQDSNGSVTQSVLYVYDIYDRRISKTIDADGDGTGVATEEHFVYDGSHIALVFDGQGNLTHRYFHGPQIDQILAEETANGNTHWALSDHQGSVRDVIDNSSSVLNHITYDSFGQVTSETDPSFDFRFGYAGRERDEESDLMYYRARYFDPATGTFVGEDPLGFAAGDANLYRYVFNSPTNFTDPSGQIAGGMEGGGVRIPWRAIGDAIVVGTGAASDYIRDKADDVWQNRPSQAETPTSLTPTSVPNLPGADAFPTTVANPGAFDPNDAQRQPQARPQTDSLTPPIPRPTPGTSDDFNPNRINDKTHSHPNSRDLIWPGGFCPTPWLDGDSRPDFEQPWFEISNELKDILGDTLKDALPGESTKGHSTQWEKDGGFDAANRDFDALNPSNVKNIPGGRTGLIEGGRKVNVRDHSSGDNSRPTLEVQEGRNRVKIRYNP